MRIATTIPDALHLCPGCEGVACGELYCERCVGLQRYFDNLWTQTGYRKRGETAVGADEHGEEHVARTRRRATARGILLGVFWESWALAMGFAVHYIWLNWK